MTKEQLIELNFPRDVSRLILGLRIQQSTFIDTDFQVYGLLFFKWLKWSDVISPGFMIFAYNNLEFKGHPAEKEKRYYQKMEKTMKRSYDIMKKNCHLTSAARRCRPLFILESFVYFIYFTPFSLPTPQWHSYIPHKFYNEKFHFSLIQAQSKNPNLFKSKMSAPTSQVSAR